MRPPEIDPEQRPDQDDPERVRRLRRVWGLLQAGAAVFLAFVALGLLPTIISHSFPALGARAAAVVWVVAPALPIALLVVAAFRLRR